MRLYLVRHGESEYNSKKIHQHGQVPLSDLGKRQAEFVAKRFKDLPVDTIIASDYERAKHTAEEIAKVVGKDIIFNPLLHEIKRPTEIENKRFDDPEAMTIKKQLHENRHDENWQYSDEDNVFRFKNRINEFLQQVKQRNEERIIVVSHAVVMRMMLMIMMYGVEKIGPDEFDHSEKFFYLNNTGLSIVDYVDGQWQLITWNDFAHLGE